MIKGIYQSARALQVKVKNLEVLSQNLANISTTGYKREIPFSELVNRFEDERFNQVTDFTQGAMTKTDNPFQLAINGAGFFVLETERGLEITRNGNFTINEQGYLVNNNGYRVLGQGGPISVENVMDYKNKAVKIKTDGEIRIGDELIGKLRIVKISEQQNLSRTGNSAFVSEDNDIEDASDEEFTVNQGFLETSNVNAIIEMQEMIGLNKDYEASQKVIGFYDTTLAKSIDIGRF